MEQQLQGQNANVPAGLSSNRQGAVSRLNSHNEQANHTQYSTLNMELTNLEPGARGQLEQAAVEHEVQEEPGQAVVDQAEAWSAGSTLQGIRGFLSGILEHVVGPQPDGQEDHVSVEEGERQMEESQVSAQNTTSRLIPPSFFDSPDIPPRRHQPVRKGRPSSYKV